MEKNSAIGIFDSGIGGISVFRRIRDMLPDEDIIYLADQNNMPYGSKDLQLILDYAKGITEFLLSKNCKLIVIACNTACAAALHPLRKLYPGVLFVGMEPAVKPAAELSKTKSVGVLATEGTFKGDPYAGVLRRFASGVNVYEQSCSGLAEAIESQVDPEMIRSMLRVWIEPLIKNQIDQLALACTHYPLVYDLIKEIAGEGINVIDPAEAIARRVSYLLDENNALADTPGSATFYSTAESAYNQSGIVYSEFELIINCNWNDSKCLTEQ